eukprot:2945202-Pyramimonas_sp.AAC.1
MGARRHLPGGAAEEIATCALARRPWSRRISPSCRTRDSGDNACDGDDKGGGDGDDDACGNGDGDAGVDGYSSDGGGEGMGTEDDDAEAGGGDGEDVGRRG